MFSQSFLLDVGQEMESQQREKKNDKCDENNSDTTENKSVIELGDEIDIKLDGKETVDNQRNDKWENINSYASEEEISFGVGDDKEIVQTQRNTNLYSKLELYDYIDHDQMINALDDENKVDAGESNDQNLNLEIFEKWMVKIFPPNLNARLIIILIFITVVLCFITFGQLIWILVLSRSPIVVQPFIPKGNNPFCK